MIVNVLELIWKWPDVFAFYQTAFTNKKDFGKEERKAAWATQQRTLHGLQSIETKMFSEKGTFRDISIMAEEAKRRAEIARLVFLLKLYVWNKLQIKMTLKSKWLLELFINSIQFKILIHLLVLHFVRLKYMFNA